MLGTTYHNVTKKFKNSSFAVCDIIQIKYIPKAAPKSKVVAHNPQWYSLCCYSFTKGRVVAKEEIAWRRPKKKQREIAKKQQKVI